MSASEKPKLVGERLGLSALLPFRRRLGLQHLGSQRAG
jgi:hypothetical protein